MRSLVPPHRYHSSHSSASPFLLANYLVCFALQVVALVPKLVRAMLEALSRVTHTFRKTAANFHYEFNPRHLTRLAAGMLLSRREHFTSELKVRCVDPSCTLHLLPVVIHTHPNSRCAASTLRVPCASSPLSFTPSKTL